MVLAFMISMIAVSVSFLAVTLLAFQATRQMTTSAENETSVALRSGIAVAAQNVATEIPLTTTVSCAAALPSTPITDNGVWFKNTNNAISAAVTASDISNVGWNSEIGVYRWWADCSEAASGIITVTVESSNLSRITRNSASVGSVSVTPLQSARAVFKKQQLWYVENY